MNARRTACPARQIVRGAFAGLLIGFLAGCAPGPADWIEQLKSEDATTRRSAAERLAEAAPTSPEVVTVLIEATVDTDPEVRRWACRGLGRHEAADAVPELESRLRDPSKAVRRASAFSLQRLAPESSGYQRELLSGMKEGDGGLIVLIKDFEPPASWAVPVLLELTKDRRPGIRRLAIEALAEIAPEMDAPRKAFETARRDSDDRVRQAASKALERK